MGIASLGLRARLVAAFGVLMLLAVVMASTAVVQLSEEMALVSGTAPVVAARLASVRNLLVGLALVAVVLGSVFAAGLARSIAQPLSEAVHIAETVASGDLSQDFETQRTGEFGRLLSALGTMEDTLTELVGNIKGTTGAITVASRQIAAGNSELSQRTEQQAASLEQTAASVEQFSATVRQNAERASSASRLASGAVEVAQRGGAIVGEVVVTMDKINGSSRKIGDIIGVIDGIAAQTNILALNAAVEAARAGEHGRGFAVVATEVRSLAQRSAAAAREVKSLIEDSVQQADNGNALVRQAGETMSRIVQSVTEVHGVLGEISTASAEQSNGIVQVHQALSHMDSVTQQNAHMVQQAADATHALAEQAQHLQQAVDAFRL